MVTKEKLQCPECETGVPDPGTRSQHGTGTVNGGVGLARSTVALSVPEPCLPREARAFRRAHSFRLAGAVLMWTTRDSLLWDRSVMVSLAHKDCFELIVPGYLHPDGAERLEAVIGQRMRMEVLVRPATPTVGGYKDEGTVHIVGLRSPLPDVGEIRETIGQAVDEAYILTAEERATPSWAVFVVRAGRCRRTPPA